MARGDALTPRQEAFALGVASGKTQADAYRASYKAGRMTPKQIHEEASKLAGSPKVSQRVAELKERITNAGIASASRVLLEASRLALFDPRKLSAEAEAKVAKAQVATETKLAEIVNRKQGSGRMRLFYVKASELMAIRAG